jgi:hypothetical protein
MGVGMDMGMGTSTRTMSMSNPTTMPWRDGEATAAPWPLSGRFRRRRQEEEGGAEGTGEWDGGTRVREVDSVLEGERVGTGMYM